MPSPLPLLTNAAGIDWPSPEAAQRAWEDGGKCIRDLPTLDPENARFARYLAMSREGDTWSSFTERVDTYLAAAGAPSDILLPVYGDPVDGDCKGFPVEPNNRELASRVLAQAGGHWSADCADPVVHGPFLACARTLSLWANVTLSHDEKVADWVWAPLRCFFAGAGFPAWARIVGLVTENYPLCPWSERETRAEWDILVLEAHKTCGHPVQVGWLPWRDVCAVWDDGEHTSNLLRGLVALHTFKHCRLSSDAQRLRILYRGAVEWQLPPDSSAVFPASSVKTSSAISRLDMPVPEGKGKDALKSPLTAAWRAVWARLSRSDLTTLRPLRDLPGYYLHGDWSRLDPAPVPPGAFTQHGVRVAAVREARGGTVRAADQDAELILDYEWRVSAATADVLARQADFEHVCPATYQARAPGQVLLGAFPHLDLSWCQDPRAYLSLLCAPVLASQLRSSCPELAREFPMLVVFPVSPTVDGSTNQGKTALAETLGRAMLFDQAATRVPDSTSAPDSRAAAEPLRAKGTLILDEWVQPQSKSHVLCAENLQSLCVGRSVSVGRALENVGGVRLKHSLCLSAKAACLPPDLMSRTLPAYLGNLSEAQRADAALFQRISSGAVALDLLLAGLSVLEGARFQALWPGAARFATSRAYRFGWHRALAVCLYMVETGAGETEAQVALDTEARQLAVQMQEHTARAVDSGLWDDLVGAQFLKLPITALFEDLLPQDCEAIRQFCEERISGTAAVRVREGGALVSVTTLLHARAALMGLEGRALRALLPHFLPGAAQYSDRQISRAAASDLRARVPVGQARLLPGLPGDLGWVIERASDSGGAPRVRLNLLPEGAGWPAGRLGAGSNESAPA